MHATPRLQAVPHPTPPYNFAKPRQKNAFATCLLSSDHPPTPRLPNP